MSEQHDLILSCSSPGEIVSALNALTPQIPLEVRGRFLEIFVLHVSQFGLEGTYERLNGRTVSEIFELETSAFDDPIVSGELDGLKFRLFDRQEGK